MSYQAEREREELRARAEAAEQAARDLADQTELATSATEAQAAALQELERQAKAAHDVAQALLSLRSAGDERLMADAFPAFAVSLARFC